MMDQVLLPALTARLDAEVDEKRRILAGHEAKSLDAAEDLVTRQRANDTMAIGDRPVEGDAAVLFP